MTADFSPQNPQSEPGQRSPSPSFILGRTQRETQKSEKKGDETGEILRE